MSVPVTLPEGVSTTMTVFRLMHNAFLSAMPSSVVSRSSDPTVNKKRYLREFKDLYVKGIESNERLHDPNSVKDLLKEKNGLFRQNGDKLIQFADTWNTYILAARTSKLPTLTDQKMMRDELLALDKINYADDDPVGRSNLVKEIIKITLKPRYSRFPELPTSLGRILDKKRQTNNRTNSYNPYNLDVRGSSASTTYRIDNLSRDDIRELLTSAKALVEEAIIKPLDPESATWVDFATVDVSLLDSSELSGEPFGEHRQTALSLMKSIDLMYSKTLLGDAFVTFLQNTSELATKFVSDLSRAGASQSDTEHADALKKYSNALTSLSVEINKMKTPDGSKLQASFDAQFASQVKTINEVGNRLASTWGSTSVITNWTKAPTVPYKSMYTKVTGSAAAAGAVSSGAGSGGVAGTTGGPLTRTIDMERVKECQDLVTKFVKSLDTSDRDSAQRLLQNTQMSLAQITKAVQDLRSSNPDDSAMKIDGLRDQQARMIRQFITRARGVMTRQRDRHVMFAMRFNRAAMQYMFYWRDCGDPALRNIADEYVGKLKDARSHGSKEIDAIMSSVEILMRDGNTYTGLTDPDIERIVEMFERIREYRQTCQDRIIAVHSKPSTFVDQLASDTHVHVIYLLKLVRFGLAWMALSIATKAFTSVYASNVYVKNIDPPQPLIFLAMFFGVDLAMNVGLLTALWAAFRVFKSPSNDFPIDGYLLSAWAADLMFSEVVMMVISFAFGNIIATKKAFRYRQEGDRGVRALGQMMLYSYGVILLIPFFRVV